MSNLSRMRILHEVQDRCCISSPGRVNQHPREDMFVVFGNCLTSVPTVSYPRQVSYAINSTVLFLRLSCAGRCCCRDCELVFHFLPTFCFAFRAEFRGSILLLSFPHLSSGTIRVKIQSIVIPGEKIVIVIAV